MGKRIISEKVLLQSLKLLDLHIQQLATIDEMRKAVAARRDTVAEIIRANWIGDDHAFNLLKQGFIESDSRGSTRRYYDSGVIEGNRTLRTVAQVRAWAATPKESGCGECDCSFPCYNGADMCIRNDPGKDRP